MQFRHTRRGSWSADAQQVADGDGQPDQVAGDVLQIGFLYRRAAWAVVHDDGRVEHRRVGYDHERSAASLVERFGDKEWTRTIAGRVRNARFS